MYPADAEHTLAMAVQTSMFCGDNSFTANNDQSDNIPPIHCQLGPTHVYTDRNHG